MLTFVISSISPLPSLCREFSQRFCQCRKYGWNRHFETAFTMFINCFRFLKIIPSQLPFHSWIYDITGGQIIRVRTVGGHIHIFSGQTLQLMLLVLQKLGQNAQRWLFRMRSLKCQRSAEMNISLR
jgi:hypothetical protein